MLIKNGVFAVFWRVLRQLYKTEMNMDISCAILHRDVNLAAKLQKYMECIPAFHCCGVFTSPVEALNQYYKQKVEVYFVEIPSASDSEISGTDFAKLLDVHTRVVFIADTDRYAAECFRLDALDYLTEDVDFPTFYQTVGKTVRWFSMCSRASTDESLPAKTHEEVAKVLSVKTGNRIMRLELDTVNYLEGYGDYIKVYCRQTEKPILCLCSLKSMEEVLPPESFVRIHRSYIVRLDRVSVIEEGLLTIGQKQLPVGASYRKRLQECVSRLMVGTH